MLCYIITFSTTSTSGAWKNGRGKGIDMDDKTILAVFAARESVEQVEEGCNLAPKFDADAS